MFIRQITSLLGLLAIFSVQPLRAESTEDVIAALQEQVSALTQRLEKLEQRSRVPQRDYAIPQIKSVSTVTPNWADRIKLQGDFRFRHEVIDSDNSSQRHRQRIRARPELKAIVSDNVSVGFGLATGSADPISSNQTLGDGLSSKSIRLDLAYVDWATQLNGLNVTAGKFRNPIRRVGGNGLLWDNDLRPEGTSLSYTRGPFSAAAIGLWVDESAQDDDSFVLGGQLAWAQPLNSSVNLLAGAGYFNFADVKGEPVFFDGDPRGNSVDAAGNYLNGYEELELFAELTFYLADVPVTLSADYVQNLAADDFDTGYALGGKISLNTGNGSLQLSYIYQDLEADAVLGKLTDSDFIGGGTDGKGHILRAGYSLTEQIRLNGTLFLNERGGDLGGEEDYQRLQLDILFEY